MLVRGLLAEQLYRARAIASGHPYHRAGRPRKSCLEMCAGGDPARVSCASVLTAIEAALLRCSETRRARRYAALSLTSAHFQAGFWCVRWLWECLRKAFCCRAV
jgi:hypothetical protein